MKTLIEKLVQLSAEKANQIDTEKINRLRIIHNPCELLSLQSLFMYWFNTFPNSIQLDPNTHVEKACEHILSNYSDEIKEIIVKDKKGKEIINVIIWLYDDVLINLSSEYNDRLMVYYRVTPYEIVAKLAQEISKLKKDNNKPKICVIHQSYRSLDITKMKINLPEMSIEDNYNDDFLPVHETIIKRLQKKNDKGLVLLHGKPGTGKTFYLRYLITQLRKDVIFLPPNMAASITDPGLVELLLKNKNSVFVVEDAENILIDRTQTGSSAVSALLNLTDGLLSDCLNIQIICSFNTDLSRLDKALLRKGRLIAKYEFNELDVAKAQALSDKLGFDTKIEKPMTLTDIYNQNEDSYATQINRRKPIGFNVAI